VKGAAVIRLLPLSLLALVLVPAAVASARTADGCPPSSCGAQSITSAGSRLLYVRPSGTIGPLRAYDLATGKQRFALRGGLLSADGSRFFRARMIAAQTTIARYETTAGLRVGRWSMPGRWWLAGISANGRWLAVAASEPGRGMTRLAVVATDRRRVVRTLPLRGWWEIETVSNDGRRLFLIQHLRTSYVVRLYDVAKGQLRAGSLKIKGESPQMVGSAWGSVGSPDGKWLLTLYIKSDGQTAFVHALDLRLAYARCLDLPTGDAPDFPSLSQYVFVLSADGASLYAANPTLGIVAKLDLAQGKVVQTTRFRGAASPSGAPASAAIGAMSHDGRTIYFSTGGPIWAFDSAFGRVRGPYAAGRIVGMGFSPDDRRLYAVRAGGSVATLDAARGTTLRR
jgi:hypothetical protein